jgi:hypothetical protein
LAVGFADHGSHEDVALARYTVNGRLDSTFGRAPSEEP